MNDSATPLHLREIVWTTDREIDVRRGLRFTAASGRTLELDMYVASSPFATPAPAVVIASGYRDEGFATAVGCRFMEMGWTTSWARLIASSGMTVFAYSNEDPAADFVATLRAIRDRSKEWNIDADRIGIFASSGHGPVALSALMKDFPVDIRCAAIAYGYTLDVGSRVAVAEAAGRFHFADPCSGRSMDDLRANVPLLLVRAGRDEMPGLNDALDAFVAEAIARGVEVTLVNHAEAPHAFDLSADSRRTRAVMRSIVDFLAAAL